MNDKDIDIVAEAVGRFLAAIIYGVFLFVVASIIITFLWNRVVPEVFHLAQITLGQGFCLTALAAAASAVRVIR
jgi:hypothetical protein